MYTVDKRRVSNNVTWRDITLPSHVTVDLSVLNWHMTVIQIFSLQFHEQVSFTFGRLVDSMSCQLLSSEQFENNDTSPLRVAVDTRGNHTHLRGSNQGHSWCV
jgi:hypothetical protein